ncbi:DoxX family protein [Undibacterium sp. 14-3-2]|uniref:DoxX family protein n=1 Tax=Undibacterium sp. 14-3-2 TaxID=2800129 RepID=UPI001905F052|nr:DoxX family protein [Undibacterium sp. 14-3-2]MBK1891717.1 DoxX family protein [Undibacterium sp. 14-3-2]
MSKKYLNQLLTRNFPDAGLLLLRLAGSLLLIYVHGLPKITAYSAELRHIEDPLHIGATLTLSMAIFSEVFCPVLIALGFLTRLACLPVLFLLFISMLFVHPEWTIAEGQFGWLLMIIFASIALAGPGCYSLQPLLLRNSQSYGKFG